MHFFSVYKQLERGKHTEVKAIGGDYGGDWHYGKGNGKLSGKVLRKVRRMNEKIGTDERIYRKRRIRRNCRGKISIFKSRIQ